MNFFIRTWLKHLIDRCSEKGVINNNRFPPKDVTIKWNVKVSISSEVRIYQSATNLTGLSHCVLGTVLVILIPNDDMLLTCFKQHGEMHTIHFEKNTDLKKDNPPFLSNY